MKVVTGNLVTMAQDGHFDIIVHGCNCQKNMGAGIAKQIARVWPKARKADDEGKPKMGGYTVATVSCNGEPAISSRSVGVMQIINGYTQVFPGKARGRGRDNYAHRLSSIRRLFEQINADFPAVDGFSIGIPLIGAGLAGGSWKDIEPLIAGACPRQFITLVRLPR